MQPRKLVVAALSIVGAWAGASCAKGTGITDETAGGGGEGTGAASASGTGGATAEASSQASASATSTSGAGGSGGEACAEMPCKLVAPQCGCDPGKACSIQLPTSANPSGRVCANEGTAKIAEKCTSQCEAGALCVQASTTVSTCLEFCDDDSKCNAPGGLCAVKLNDGKMGTIPDATLCSDNCNPPSNAGCPVSGTSCQLGQEPDGQMRYFTMCRGAGAGTQGTACTLSDECATGYGCFTLNTVMQCLKFCEVGGGTVCPGVTTCNPFDPSITISTTEYGACT